MPLYLEARDLVAVLAEREECSSVFSPGSGVGKRRKIVGKVY